MDEVTYAHCRFAVLALIVVAKMRGDDGSEGRNWIAKLR